MPSSRRTILLGLLAAGAAGGLGLWIADPLRGATAEGAMSPPELATALAAEEVILIDIRRPEEWKRSGVAPEAHLIDMRRKDFLTALETAMAEAPGKPAALICAGGVRSRRLTAALAERGITNIIDVPEGMMGSRAGPGWIARGLPTVPYTQG